MKSLISQLVIFCLVVVSSYAFAGRGEHRQAKQRSRIHQGVKSGELTHSEASELRKGERHVRHMKKKAGADGQITDQEAAKIEGAEDHMSEEIYKEKHDDEKRGE